ncbi:hypothetical protein GCM10010912_69550 [Paenibacillus albidus]|uniref:DUF6973 domain-containing protein n=1 Tax=Paenibacillus albidus TaxID=2041023 RepID=A0A917LE48_9BACL|nr:hypothetical protein [Paenibacillus albidus]GGG15224.1 hypothetical protein GCM10010912_69550 [Paenibacillus albidus]
MLILSAKKVTAVSILVATILNVPTYASAQEEKIKSVTDAVYQEDITSELVDSDFDFISEAIDSSAIQALEDYKVFYSNIALKDYSELTPEEIDQMTVHLNKIISILDSHNENGNLIQPMGYDESALSKMIELNYSLYNSGLSTLDILEGANAATPARKAGEAYALAHGWGTTTWDNPADALRHFSWNFLMGQRIGVITARSIADTHEAALVAAKRAMAEMPGLSKTEQSVYGAALINDIITYTRASYSSFNATFNNSSIMDINNNSQGRKYSQRSYAIDDYMAAFNDAYWSDIEWYDTGVGTADRERAFGVWQ